MSRAYQIWHADVHISMGPSTFSRLVSLALSRRRIHLGCADNSGALLTYRPGQTSCVLLLANPHSGIREFSNFQKTSPKNGTGEIRLENCVHWLI